MWAIFKREFKAYFQSVIGWVFLAAIMALYGLYFFVYNLRSGYPYISYSLSAIAFIMLIAVPILAMRSLAEEKKSKTDQLILTAPISVGKVVVGKYLAMVAVFAIDMLVVAVTPLILSIFGTIPLAESYVAVIGFFLYGAACIAIGMFISSITESQVIAAVLSFAALFLGYMMSNITGLISSSGNLLTKILGCYDIYTPLETFMNGCFDLTGFVYFLTIICLFLFLTGQSIQKRRWSSNTKKISLGAFHTGFVAAAIAVAVILNLAVQELPATITSIDATSTKMYSLTDDTKEYLKNLDTDVTIYVLASESSADTTLGETLERYEGLSDHIKVVYKNPSKYPTFYQQYTDSSPTSNSLIVVSEERSRVVDYSDIYEYSYDYTTYSQSVDGYDAEGQLTSAIQYVTMDSDELPVIYEIQGHGETSLSGGFSEVVEKANITLSDLTLLKEDAIPDDAAAIIINAPTSDLSADDTQKVLDYLQAGGKAILVCNFQYQDLENFNSILSAYGVSQVQGVVMEQNSSYYYQGIPYYLLPEVASTDYTSSVSNSYIFAPYSVGLTYGDDTDDTTYQALLTTTDDAISKVDLENFTTYEYEDGDINGPFNLAVAVEQTVDDDNTTNLVVVGSFQLLNDSADEIVSGNNASMFKDILSTLIGDSQLSTSVIAAKDYSLSTITVTTAAAVGLGLSAIIVIPVLMIVLGIVIWARRRKK